MMIRKYDLRKPGFEKAAAGGHFGRTDVAFPWEAIDENALKNLKAMLK